MKINKTLSVLLPLFLLIACSRIDDETSVGGDIISGFDSTATDYDGRYRTKAITLRDTPISDAFGGLHIYSDSLNRNGGRQGELAIGRWESQTSEARVIFKSDTALSATSLSAELETLGRDILKRRKIEGDRADLDTLDIKGDLIFTTNVARTTADKIPVEIMLSKHLNDSIRPADEDMPVIGRGLVSGSSNSGSIPLNLRYIQTSHPFIDTTVLVTIENSYSKEIIRRTDTLTSANRRIPGDTTVIKTLEDLIDSRIYKEARFKKYSELIPYRLPYNINQHHLATGRVTSNIDTVGSTITVEILNNREVIDSLKIRELQDSIHITYPAQEIRASGVATSDSLPDGRTLRTYIDTLFIYSGAEVKQSMLTKEITQPVRGEVSVTMDGTEIAFSDSFSLVLRLPDSLSSELLYISSPHLRVSAPIDGDRVLARRVNPVSRHMVVTDSGDKTTATDGGVQQFSRITLSGMQDFWRVVFTKGFRSIVFTDLEFKASKIELPEYHGGSIPMRGIILDTLIDEPQDLLKLKGLKSFQFQMNSEKSVRLKDNGDLLDNILDILYKGSYSANNLPATYLYVWIDNGHLGRVFWNESQSTASFTYIAQDAK